MAEASAPPSAPISTYRLQLRDSFGFEAAAAQADYLAALGVTHVYLSPILQANPGSAHGYDVVDHSLVSTDLGGEDAFRAMVEQFHRHDLGVVVDVVPNHMARPTPELLNRQLWSVLYQGQAVGVRALVRRRLGRAGGQDAGAHPGRAARGVPARPDHRDLPAGPRARRAPRSGAALLRSHAPAPRRCGRPAAGRAAGPAALPAHRLARRGHPAQLPAVLRHRLADRDPGRRSGRVRRHPPGSAAPAGRGADRRPADRPPRRAGRPAPATCPGWPRPPATPGWWWRRSSPPERSCRTGAARAPPATTPST